MASGSASSPISAAISRRLGRGPLRVPEGARDHPLLGEQGEDPGALDRCAGRSRLRSTPERGRGTLAVARREAVSAEAALEHGACEAVPPLAQRREGALRVGHRPGRAKRGVRGFGGQLRELDDGLDARRRTARLRRRSPRPRRPVPRRPAPRRRRSPSARPVRGRGRRGPAAPGPARMRPARPAAPPAGWRDAPPRSAALRASAGWYAARQWTAATIGTSANARASAAWYRDTCGGSRSATTARATSSWRIRSAVAGLRGHEPVLEGLLEARGEVLVEVLRAAPRAGGRPRRRLPDRPGRSAASSSSYAAAARARRSRSIGRSAGASSRRTRRHSGERRARRAATRSAREPVSDVLRSSRARGDQLLHHQRRARGPLRDQDHDRGGRPLTLDALDERRRSRAGRAVRGRRGPAGGGRPR